MARSAGISIGVCALAIATLGLVIATGGLPGAGVSAENPGGLVLSVDPGLPAWFDGIRPGQQVIELESGSDPVDWRLETSDGAIIRQTTVAGYIQEARALVGQTVLAWALGIAGMLALIRGRRVGMVASAAGVVVAGPAYAFADPRAIMLIGGASTLLVPASAAALVAGAAPRGRVAFCIAGAAVTVAWLAAAIASPGAFDSVDAARRLGGLLLVGAAAVIVVDRHRLRAWLSGREAPHIVDVAAASLWIAAVVVAWLVVRLDPLPLMAVAGGSLVAYPAWRRLAIRALDDWIMGDVRRRASILAVEQERARLARDIHDAPLAELSGVIRQLDRLPEAHAESDALRTVAAQLRDVAVQLNPPVLEDLGLAPAIQALAEQTTPGSPPVEVEVDDLSQHRRADRPPADVELAAYRIVQEALANARNHASATSVRVIGTISDDSVDLEIADDGAGIDPAAVHEARMAGHFGLETMEQRARAIGGRLSIEPGRPGTIVRLTWTR